MKKPSLFVQIFTDAKTFAINLLAVLCAIFPVILVYFVMVEVFKVVIR